MDPKSDILGALYKNQREEANRLADAAGALTVWEAAALGRLEPLAAALSGDASLVNAFAPDGHTPLGLACFFGAPQAVQVLIEKGADVHAASRNAMTVQPLHAAVAGRNFDAARLLLEHGARVNARQQVGYTPLMSAAASGRDDLVDLLLTGGADPALTNAEGKTAADVARDHKHEALAARLTPASAG